MDNSHFIDMIRAIQPHVSGRPKRSVELMLQSANLISSVHEYHEPQLSACDTSQDYIDFEALLTDLQDLCNPAEAELVSLILNFFRSRKIYSAYQNTMHQNRNASFSLKNTGPLSADNSASDKNECRNTPPQKNKANDMRDIMENPAFQSLLSPAQRENLNQLGSIMQAFS